MIRDHESGQSLIEFALVLPLFLAVVVGVVDVGRAAWQTNTLALACREGTRYAIVHGSKSSLPSGPTANDPAVANAVLGYTTGIWNVSVSSTWPDGNNQRGSRVVVGATAPFVPTASAILLNGGLAVVLRCGSTLTIQQ